MLITNNNHNVNNEFYSTPGGDELPIDPVEKISTEILSHLHSVADRLDRSEIEKVNSTKEEEGSSIEILAKKSGSFNRFRPLQEETNFCETESGSKTVTVGKGGYNFDFIFSIFKNLLLGGETFDNEKDKRSAKEMIQVVKKDETAWSDLLQKHYIVEFQTKMKKGLKCALSLLKDRQGYARWSFYERVVFYSSLALTIFAKVTSRKILANGSLKAATVTFIFMCVHYGMTSFMQSRKILELKSLTEELEKEAAISRHNF